MMALFRAAHVFSTTTTVFHLVFSEVMVIIDGSNLSYRFYFASQQLEDAVPMWLSFLSKLSSVHPSLAKENECIIVFDGKDKNRDGKPDGYKEHRKPPPESLISSIDRTIQILADIGFRIHVTVDGVEADVDIARFSKHYSHDSQVFIISSDKDLLQLVNDSVSVIRPIGKGEYRLYTSKTVTDEFGVTPDQLPSYLTLAGDSSDGIKGLRGCGAKTAVKLLENGGSLLSLTDGQGKWCDAIRENLDYLVQVYETVNLRRLKAASCQAISSPNRDSLSKFSRVYQQLSSIMPWQ